MHGSANVGFRRGTPVRRFSAAKHGFNRNISFTWQAMQKFSGSLNNSMLRGVLYILGDFRVYLGGESFSQRISKIRRNKKFKRLNLILL